MDVMNKQEEEKAGKYVFRKDEGIYSPRLIVYGIRKCPSHRDDIQAFGAKGLARCTISTVYHPAEGGADQFSSSLSIVFDGKTFSFEPLDDPEKWEQKTVEDCRESGTDVLKVGDPEDIRPVGIRHLERYAEQLRSNGFEDIVHGIGEKLNEFKKERPECF